MAVDIAGYSAAAVFAIVSAWHVYWALGGRAGSASAVPRVGDRSRFVPSATATLVVATLVAVSAALVVGGVRDWPPPAVFRIGCAGIAAVLVARAIGDLRYVGLFKRVRNTEFARRDTWLFSPLCLGLAGAAALVALRS